MSDPTIAASPPPAVRVRGLVKRYGDVTAVDGIDFDVRRGRCLGLLGPNGAGKTTTIEILEGLKDADAGTVEVLGRTWAADRRAIQQRIGVQLQETDFQDKLTVREILRLFASFYPRSRPLDEVVATIGLQEKRDVYAKSLSGGQRQRLALGCAILNHPEILFLDEPTTGLDPQARRMLWDVVERFKAGGGTVLLTTHYMDEAERLADDLVIVDRGRIIAEGSPADIIASLGAESLVSLTLVDAAVDAIDPAELATLAALDGVESARVDGERLVLVVHRTQVAIAGLFAWLDARGLQLADLRTHRPTLEDVFVSMTGKHLRDG
jgi:ABC-2 type transport system ATP-binding protein